MTKSVTFLWLLPRTPVTWAKKPDEVPHWDLSPSYFWSGYIATANMYESRGDEPKAPSQSIQHYPRLVRVLEPQPEYPFNVEPPEHPYEILSRILPDLYAHIFDDTDFSEKPRETPPAVSVKLDKIKKVAEDYGLLVHPKYGNSAYGWVAAAFLFQTLTVLWRVLELEFDKSEMEPLSYGLTIERLRQRWSHVPELLIGKERVNAFDLPRPPVFRAFTDTRPRERMKFPRSKNELRSELIYWLNEEFNRSIGGPVQSDLTFYVDQTQGMSALLVDEGKEPLSKGEAIPHFGVKAGLYAYALYTFLLDFRAGGELKTCEGCGRLFFPTRSNAKHCNVSRDSCRKRAERNRKKGLEST